MITIIKICAWICAVTYGFEFFFVDGSTVPTWVPAIWAFNCAMWAGRADA